MPRSGSDVSRSWDSLPWVDPSIDALTVEDRRVAAIMWAGRASGEQQTALTFELITRALHTVGASSELVALAERAVRDERGHATLCLRVASRFRGADFPAPRMFPLRRPAHPGIPSLLRASLHIIEHCAINESTASVFLQYCFDHAAAPLARAAMRELLSDEIDHARIGWSHLAALAQSTEGRAMIAPRIVSMLASNFRGWTDKTPPTPSDALVAHGCIRMSVVRAIAIDAMDTLIIPGFEHVGFDVAEARAWLDGVRTA